MVTTSLRPSDVVVIGAGVIGTAVAWRCAQRGHSVTLVDGDPRRGAWRVAAGMLAPVTELSYTEEPLHRLGLDSLARYPGLVGELAELTGVDVGLRRGTLLAAWDAADLAALRDLQAFWRALGLTGELLTGRELHGLEPALAPGLPGALHAPQDGAVDPRRLHAALTAAAGAAGVVQVAADARVRVEASRAIGVDLADGTTVSAGTVVLAAGAWSAGVGGLPVEARHAVRPVKGQTLRLRPRSPVLRRVVRATVKGNPIYLVPRPNGELVVGASVEEAGFDEQPRAGALYDLLRDALTVVPELSEAAFTEHGSGFRPGSPDNAPLIGPAGLPGLVHATGHFRNGVLLTPVTADAVADLVSTGELPAVVAPFRPDRFAPAVAR